MSPCRHIPSSWSTSHPAIFHLKNKRIYTLLSTYIVSNTVYIYYEVFHYTVLRATGLMHKVLFVIVVQITNQRAAFEFWIDYFEE